MAIGEGDIVNFVSTDNLCSAGPDANVNLSLKTVLKSVSIGFTIKMLKFHPQNDGFLAVYGNKDCIIISLDPQNIKVHQTLKLELMLDQLGPDLYIVDCLWLPNCQTHFTVMTKMDVKIYDLSKDKLSPAFYINQIEDTSGVNMMTSMAIEKVNYTQDPSKINDF